MIGALGVWDALFGEKVELELPDGSKRRVTKKWLDKMVREGKARPVSSSEALCDAASTADARARDLLHSSSEHAEALGVHILLMSIHEVPRLMEVWDRDLDDATQVRLFSEYAAFLITYVDRLVLRRFGAPRRSEFMIAVIRRVRLGFLDQPHLGETATERDDYLDNLIASRLEQYGTPEDMGSYVFAVAKFLVESFCDHVPESERPRVALETARSMSNVMFTAVDVLPEFKALVTA